MFEVVELVLNGQVLAASIHFVHLCTYCRVLKRGETLRGFPSIQVLCVFTYTMNVFECLLRGT
jgi:hypothetical protein